MKEYCLMSGETNVPFTTERFPPVFSSHTLFVRCRSCVSKGPGFKLERYIGSSNPMRYFIECTGCGALLFCHIPGIPDMYAQFKRTKCPKCEALLPTGSEIVFRVQRKKWEIAEKSSVKEEYDDILAFYTQMTSAITQHPNLSQIVTRTLLVKNPPYKSSFIDKVNPTAYQVWIVRQEVDIDQGDAIRFLLQMLVDGALKFYSSQRLDAALKKEGLEVIKEN